MKKEEDKNIEQPTDEAIKALAEVNKPKAAAKKTTSDEKKPAPEAKKPTPEKKKPTAEKKKPAAEKKGKAEAKADDEKGEEKTLKEVIQEQAREDESPLATRLSLRKILGGDILYAQALRKQIGVMLLITFFLILYIANRYSIQQKLIEIDKLQTELQDAKYKALSSNSQLTEESRESHVLEMLKTNKDSLLKIPNQPPYIITVPDQK